MAGNKTSLLLMMATSLIALSTVQAAEPAAKVEDTKEKPAVTATQLDAVTTTATRNAQSLNEIPGTVSVIDSETLERNNARNPRDAIKYEPGVSVGNQPLRGGGGTNYTIRGINNNRVLLLMDGQGVPDFPESNAGPGTYTRDFVDLENVKQIEIIRGPASALYGSDALGGIVSYISKDPEDYLDLVGKDWFGSIKGAYSSADKSFSETATGAMRAGNVEALAIFTRRDGEETEPKGSVTTGNGVKVNPQDYYSNNFLGKLVFRPTTTDIIKLTGEYSEKQLDTNMLTDLSVAPSTVVVDSKARDNTERVRVSLDYTHDAPIGFIDRTQIKAFYTSLDRTEHTDQKRSAGTTLRVSDFGFYQDIFGADAQFNTTRNLFGVPNAFTYGISGEFTTTERPRYRYQTTGGITTTVISGETFPNKTFPDNDTTKAGIYVQDEITIDRLTLVPALRVDYYNMKPKPDQMFLNSGGAIVSEMTETPVSPKLGVTYAFTDEYTGFAQYAHGFRVPPYDSANQAFANAAFGYEIIVNPDLKPETSDGVEAGFRGKFANGSSFSTSAFYNQYQDFIDAPLVCEGTIFGGAGPCFLSQYQYTNLPNVHIYGAEARGDYRFLPNWALLGSLAYAYGEDESTKAAIDSVDPLKLVAGLRYTTENWGTELTMTHAWQHSRVSNATYFKAPEYTTFDLTAYVEVMPTFTINAGVFNLTDEKYFVSQDVMSQASASTTLDRYAQPGRNVGVNATIRF
ncbi:MAG: TonB-dependent hemoglobin/transferrin/lactoferrin family receptor [Parvibaculum sp.]|nr:TonB-dependent hemoglobin/transferrin/lactoferrin family receptor [Parvibaculum sp.]